MIPMAFIKCKFMDVETDDSSPVRCARKVAKLNVTSAVKGCVGTGTGFG